MAEYFYTIDLGEHYGPRFERLATNASYDDREEFAAMMLAHSVEQWEAREQQAMEELSARIAQGCFFADGLMRDPALFEEDDIPF
jgi:hypothetical protein